MTLRSFVLLVGILAAGVARAGATQGWRYDGSGRWPDADPPVTWSSTEHVVWATKLPSWSNASPIVVGDMVCAESEPVTLVCVDAATGKVRWSADNPIVDAVPPEKRAEVAASVAHKTELERTLADLRTAYQQVLKQARATGSAELTAAATQLARDADKLKAELAQGPDYRTPADQGMVGWSSPTPATDGTGVYALFANGVVAAYEKDGRRRWARWLGPMYTPMVGWDDGHAASPVVVGDTLIVPFRQLTALDRKTGAVKWQGQAWPHYGGAVPMTIGGVPTVVTPDGRIVRVSDGAVLREGMAQVWYFNAVVDGDRVYFLEARSEAIQRKDGGVFLKAWKVNGLSGDKVDATELWTAKVPARDSFYAGPAVAGGELQLVTRAADVFTVDAATGKVSGPVPLTSIQPTQVYSSPAYAGGRLYVTDESGRTVVLKAGPTPEVVATNKLAPTRASPAMVGGRMYVRTKDQLLAIEGK